MGKQEHLDQLALVANQKIKERNYWQQKLSGEAVKSHFPHDFSLKNANSLLKDEPLFQTLEAAFEPMLFSRLMTISGGSDHTLHIILTAALTALLYKHTDNIDIILGTPIYKQQVAGEYINTLLPLVFHLDENTTFKELLLQAKQVLSEAVEHQNFPVEWFANHLNTSAYPSSQADFTIFHTALLLQNIHDKKYLEHLHLDMTFSFSHTKENRDTGILSLTITYNVLRYRNTTIQRITSHLLSFLKTVLANLDTKISHVELMAEEEKKRLLDTFSNMDAGYPKDKTIHQLFQEQTIKTPENRAVVEADGPISLSYLDLNAKADHLASRLRQSGVTDNTIVALLLPRTPDMVVAIIAVLKAGGAYLPIDPTYPEERIHFMLMDSGTTITITSPTPNHQDNKIGDWKGHRILLEAPTVTTLHDTPTVYHRGNPANIAYIIYTSGTTGKPKGVLIEHKNVVRLLFNDSFQFDFNDLDIWTLFHSYSFDFSVWEMYGALLYGGRLVIIPRQIALDPSRFLKIVKKHQVTVLNQTPSAFYNFINEELKQDSKELTLRYVIFGGEALKPGKLNQWHQRYSHTRLINMFGITETTVHVTYKEIGAEEIMTGSSNIGRPIPTLSVYILDRFLRLLPIGIAGELCVGGTGVSRGYLNRPELTAQRFIQNPYKPGESLYKSGDLARIIENGDMEYLGRIDHQVQLHGFRIELGEIESRLLQHQAIENAVVLTIDQENELSLCAYIVPTHPDKFDVTILREHLAALLPEYMIPSYFVKLDHIPLTPNGKVDRKALPEPAITSDQYMAPQTHLEKKLAELWSQILKLESVGIKDNYFNIGGDSIKAIRLISTINTELNSSISIVDLYTHSTIETLSEKIANQVGSIDHSHKDQVTSNLQSLKDRITKEMQETANIEDIYPMTDIEKGIAFYYLKHMGSGLYHDQFVYPMEYLSFDIQRMKKALALMMAKHAILRTGFNIGDYEEHVQILYKEIPVPMEYVDISEKERSLQEKIIKERCLADRQNPFNPIHPPLWRIYFFHIDQDNVIILFVFHHAILDGWSMASLVIEVNDIYLKLATEPEFLPAPLEANYKDAVISEILEKQRSESIQFWKNELSDYSRLNFFETVKGDMTSENMKMFRYNLGREYLEKIQETAKKNNTSVKNLCFAAYVFIMNILSNEEDIVVGNVSNNRPVIQDGDKILGCFLNTVPVRVKIPHGKSWSHYIRMIEEKILALKTYERMPLFEIAKVIGEKSKDKNPLFDTLFNFKDFHVYQQGTEGREAVKRTSKHSLSIPRSEDTNTLFDFEVDITSQHLVLEPKYRPLALDLKTVQQACIYFKQIIDKFIQEPDSLMSKNDIISQEEKQKILYDFNNTAAPYASEKTMHQLFEEQVLKTPTAVAVIDTDGLTQWTYQELNQLSNQLANILKKKGMKPGDLAAVIMDRSIHMVMAVYGILKAGGAYVPLEPSLPDERIRKILESLGIRSLISNEAQLSKVANISESLPLLQFLICPDTHLPPEIELITGKEFIGPLDIAREDSHNLAPASRSEDIAYIIFTSGSTGTPKGVVETHRPVINVVEWVNKTFAIGYPDKLLFVASLSFDLSVYDIFGILASGACLRVVAAQDIKNPNTLLDIIINEGITFWDSAPAALQQLVPFFHEVAGYPVQNHLRLVFLSGDWIPVTMPDALRETFAGVQVISLGGATEATVWSNFYPIGIVDPSWPSIPYGKPIQNAKYYILDQNLQICPLRVPGDLFIGGQCLATEYINDPQLSAYKFIPSPFVPGEKIYRTGDIARWFEDGNMQFLGRKDHQVKIRGYRIELGEIESQLLNHSAISDGIVLDRVDAGGNRYLCAYYVCKKDQIEPDRDELKEYLSKELPEYMIPAYFIPIPKVPLTPNGKLDRRALPEPEVNVEDGQQYVAPQDDTQVKLVAIWSEVLGLQPEAIGIDADFFELGGHSLNATMVISRIHKELNVKIPLAEIFNSPTIRALSAKVKISTNQLYAAIEPVEKKEYYPLSSAQQRLYFLQLMEPDNTGYNIQEAVVLEGAPDLALLEETFRQLIERHESLRTSFIVMGEDTMQRIWENVPFDIQYYDSMDALQHFVRPFNLSQAPLIRVGLFPMAEGKHLLLTDTHHIISDGVSHAVLKGDFAILYSRGRLPHIRLQYKDYSQWQNNQRQKQLIGSQRAFWLNELAGEIPVLNIPSDYPRPVIQSYEGNTLKFSLGHEESKRLNKFAKNEKVTLYMALVAIYNVLFFKLCNQEEIIIGTPTAGRPHAELEKIIGMFVNTLVLKNHPQATKTFSSFLQEVKEKTIAVFANQDCQFEELVELLSVPRDPSRNPVFDVLFVLQNMVVGAEGTPGTTASPSDVRILPYHYTSRISKFDLTLSAIEMTDAIKCTLEYSTRLFKEETIQRMADYFIKITQSVLENPHRTLSEIEILSEEEKHLLLYQYNDTAAQYPRHKTLQQLFADQVAQTPDHPAVVYARAESSRPITYRQLHDRASRLAGRLQATGLLPDTIVAIIAERSIQMIVGLIAILKAGGAYLPIDPDYPLDRIDYMLRDSGTQTLVTTAALLQNGKIPSPWAGTHILMDEEDAPHSTPEPHFPTQQTSPTNLAYVIYTSGTTGKPKGVLIEHAQVVRLLFNDRFQFTFTDRDVWTMFHSYCFDFSVWEMYGALLYGGLLTLIPRSSVLDPGEFLDVLRTYHVTVLNQTPSAFYNLMHEELNQHRHDLELRYVIFGGEALQPGKLKEWQKKYPRTRLVNMFGITETTVHVTYQEIGETEIEQGISNIGKPIPTLSTYIMDKTQRLVIPGTAAELCVGGDGVARGYLNRPELTLQRFVANPYKPGERLYRSGDLARLWKGGQMEYLGRMDQQVQIRGFRVELGEIESCMLKHDGIRDAVVIDSRSTEGDFYLCAYIVPKTPQYAPATTPLDTPTLKNFLSQTLPDYMIPAYFVQLDQIPLTPNGKLDRKRLPQPLSSLNNRMFYAPPRNNEEAIMATIWQEILGLPQVGIDDHFFNIGGDSIKTIRLTATMNARFHSHIKIFDLYTHSTIRQLTTLLNRQESGDEPFLYRQVCAEIEALKTRVLQEKTELENAVEDIYPMSDIEKGMVFYYMKHAGSGIYHDQFLYPFYYKDFDSKRFEQALHVILAKHAILRTAFDLEESLSIVYHPNHIPLPFTCRDMSQLPPAQQQRQIIDFMAKDRKIPFNASIAPLWRSSVFLLGDGHLCFTLVFHHAILDGWSTASLVTEVNNTYLLLKNDPSYSPQKLKSSYKDTVIQELVEKQDHAIHSYWKNELQGYTRLEFSESLKSKGEMEAMTTYWHHTEPQLLQQLTLLTDRYHTSIKNLCFGAYACFMKMFSYENDVVVGCVTNNRAEKEDGDKVLGCFLNTVPVRLHMPTGISWLEHIERVERKMLEIKKHEHLSLFEIALAIGERSKDRNPIFDSLFNFMDFHIFHEVQAGESNSPEQPQKPAPQPATVKQLLLENRQDTNTLFDFEVDMTRGTLILCPKYNPSAISDQTVQRCCGYFLNILQKYIHEPHGVIRNTEILSPAERDQVLYLFNHTEAPFASEKTMHQLLEEQVFKTPAAVAVIDSDGLTQWTYQQLNQHANQLANLLKKTGLKPGDLAAVIMDRSMHTVMAVYGILKAGGAYVPLEPYLPDERIRKIMESLRVRHVITNHAQLAKVAPIAQTLPLLQFLICPDPQPPHAMEMMAGKQCLGAVDIAREDSHDPAPAARSEDIAYIIFTSGSTGTPKGVVETHRPVINVVEWVNKTFAVGYPDKLLFVASLSFDLSVYDIFGILASGACLRVVAGQDIKNPNTLLDIIMKEGITFWDSAPAALQQLVPFFGDVAGYSLPSRLRLVFLSGDWIPVTMPDALRDTFAGVQVISLGGATEATVWSNYYPIGIVDPSWPSIPYGKPIQNAKYYILDQNLQVCPLRVPGDLFIGGQCLATEYIHDPQLSAYKFIPNPFVDGEKIYRTGDIARWFEDGNMQFLGRKDHQVKIRGYRIELGEIESQLLNHPAIGDGIVLDRVDAGGNRYLCAYYVCKKEEREPDREALKEYLAKELPEYMIPAYFIPIPAVPLTPNGKLDRRALPEPEGQTQDGPQYVAPQDDTQAKLVAIWSEVLGLQPETIGIDADFFELGGHSLNATMVISRLHKELQVKIPLAEIFNSPTIRALSARVKTSSHQLYAAIEPVEKREYYPLSSAQRRLYFLQQMEPGNTTYNIQEGVILEGVFQPSELENTFKQLIHRHESLRTAFVPVAEETVQRVWDTVPFELEYFDTTATSRDFVRPFDLSQAPLMRVGLFRIQENKHVLLTDMHHIVSDGVSHAVLKGDFAILHGGGSLPPIRLQYKDYSEWQHSEKQQHLVGMQKAYWLKELAGEIPVLDIPTDYPRPIMQSFEGKTCQFDLQRDESQRLNQLAKDATATLYMVLVAIYNILLFKLSQQEEIIIGTPTAGRPHADLEKIIGMFVNTLVLKNHPEDTKTFSGFLNEVRDKTIKAFENQDCQFEELVELVSLQRNPARNPIFDVAFVLQNMEIEAQGTPGPHTNTSSVTMHPYQFTSNIAKFDLTLTAVEDSLGIHFTLEYASRLFKEETIQRMAEFFKKIARAVTQRADIPLWEIDILSDADKHYLLEQFNDTRQDFPRAKTIHGLFQEQVAKTPDHIALILDNPDAPHRVNYRELHQRTTHLAQVLQANGLPPDAIVGIKTERSLEMMVGILAILMSGAAYLPIDPGYPRERIDFMLADSAAPLLLTTHAHEKESQNMGRWEGNTLFLDSLPAAHTPQIPHLPPFENPESLAYVIYTSGSTGNPKGVMIEHRAVVNRLHWMQTSYPIHWQDIILQKTPIVFDVSVWELFWWAFQGASLCLAHSGAEKSPDALIDLIATYQITTMHFVPSMLQIFLEQCQNTPDITRLSSLKQVFSSGEALMGHQVQMFNTLLNAPNGTRLINLYGPTEATVDVSYFNCLPLQHPDNIPIGKPIDNIQLYVMDKHMQIQPIGVKGELCISGIGLARGYLNRPQLTMEKFTEHPYKIGEKLYRTGDIARVSTDGQIEYFGRMDQQIKIRGFRIELGEIENQLLNHEAIKGAAVLQKDQHLYAYIVANHHAGETFDISHLRSYLSEKLPAHMIPSYFVQIEKIPLTINGKVDKKALDLVGKKLDAGITYTPPQNDMEIKIADIWKEVLHLEKIGIHDNCFELGGTSFDIIKINRKLKVLFQMEIPMVMMFRYTTVHAFATYLQEKNETIIDRTTALERGKRDKQERLQRRKNPRVQ